MHLNAWRSWPADWNRIDDDELLQETEAITVRYGFDYTPNGAADPRARAPAGTAWAAEAADPGSCSRLSRPGDWRPPDTWFIA